MNNPFMQFIYDKYGSVSEFGRQIGVTWITANRYARGLQPINSDQIAKIEEQTGVPGCEIINLMKK